MQPSVDASKPWAFGVIIILGFAHTFIPQDSRFETADAATAAARKAFSQGHRTQVWVINLVDKKIRPRKVFGEVRRIKRTKRRKRSSR